MSPIDYSPGSGGPDPREVNAALKTWREGLLGLTRQSPLVKFSARKTSTLQIDQPSADEVLRQVQTGQPQEFEGTYPEDATAPPARRSLENVLHSPRAAVDVRSVVRNLMRRSKADFLDRGVSVLYLAFGLLEWKDVDGTAMLSPLVLVPVELTPDGPKSVPTLTASDDDAVVNPALTLRLREFGISLPVAEDLEGLEVSAAMDEVRRAVSTSSDFGAWDIREEVHLGLFSFAKEAMFNDLLENEAAVASHPLVQALATSDPSRQLTSFQFDALDFSDVDTTAPPELTPLVLDADSSQRLAIAAAVAGKSFVMNGPPGTGKSQTIANMIGALLHSGKRVLFVSEKIAALEVVRNRLEAAGLGSYLLELHSHKTSRKEVATELLSALDNIALPPVAMAATDRRQVQARRLQLSDYAAAMNQVRFPLNRSLHQVLGDDALLADVALAPSLSKSALDLTDDDEAEILLVASNLSKAWRPAAHGETFLWRDVAHVRPLSAPLYRARLALNKLTDARAGNAPTIKAFSFHRLSDSRRLVDLLRHYHGGAPIGVLNDWLLADSLEYVARSRQSLGARITVLREAEADLAALTPRPWTDFPSPGSLPAVPTVPSLSPAALDINDVPASTLLSLATEFESQARGIDASSAILGQLAGAIGTGTPTTMTEAETLGRLITLRSRGLAPEAAWFTLDGLAQAQSALREYDERLAMLTAAEGQAEATFTPAALQAPLLELQERFSHLHRGLKKLSSAYRRDKQAVAALLTDASDVKRGITGLSSAIAWSEAQTSFDDFSRTQASSLGHFWAGRDTDPAAIRDAVAVTQEALTLLGGSVNPGLVAYLSSSGDNSTYQTTADQALADLRTWHQDLRPAPALSGRPELAIVSLGQASTWLDAHVGPLRAAAVRAEALGGPDRVDLTPRQADKLAAGVVAASTAHDALLSTATTDREFLGDLYDGASTDLKRLDTALAWATELRRIAGGALSHHQVEALRDSLPADATEAALSEWASATDHIIEAFGAKRQQELRDELASSETAEELLSALSDDTSGQQEWFDYLEARGTLAGFGLDAAVNFCAEERVAADEVPDVLRRTVLRSWADAVMGSDPRLRPFGALDRDGLVRSYQQLDRELVHAATSEIVAAANKLRPTNTSVGEAGHIRREGTKQRRHRPVRDLMGDARTVIGKIKPVFMMSPLAVSQYLPSDMHFDVVIFDEASQVRPGDAINCVYRGKSLILAGDDKQLPPTSFFERSEDDEENDDTDVKDFPSILELAKAAGAFNNLELKWHYRSQHEGLIAFSNYKFYEGKLVTFPSAESTSDSVGLEFFKVDGVYQRGGGASNPIEAAAVAERVIDHFTHRPEMSLGVVTFSVAQATAVETALDKARESRRDLDRHFDVDNRLDGFFIRALEQVQGDERDVMIFSVGYGPDEAGKISTNFGALNRDKGWRRLNVGITRARRRVEVVASMSAGQIPATNNENVEYFRAYLDYAERGAQVLALNEDSSGGSPDSPFEESVIKRLRDWGYEVVSQVGAAGYRIDIGIRHPHLPGKFALGVECDGYQYHSSPVARDRDRLRQQVLEGLGWTLHRIWGTAWYRDRAIEERRLKEAVESAIAAPQSRPKAETAGPSVRTVTTEPLPTDRTPHWAGTYRKASPVRLSSWVQPAEAGNSHHMIAPLESLVREEGPVHMDLVKQRLREWWELGSVGKRIRANVDAAIQQSRIVADGDFLFLPGSDLESVRVPAVGVERTAAQVHLQELSTACLFLVQDSGSVARDEAVQAVARLFNWTRSGQIVKDRIGEAIDNLIDHGLLAQHGETLTASTLQNG